VALGRSYSSDQPFVGQSLPCRAVNEAIETLQGVPLHIALIEPESELIDVPAKVLRADMVEGAVNTALQDSPDAFDAVGRRSDPSGTTCPRPQDAAYLARDGGRDRKPALVDGGCCADRCAIGEDQPRNFGRLVPISREAHREFLVLLRKRG
jgi:hypothetical protein